MKIRRFTLTALLAAARLSILITVGVVRADEPAGVLGPMPPVGLYTRLVDPTEYPGYTRRGFTVPTWKTFDDRPQMVGSRYTGLDAPVTPAMLNDVPDNDANLAGRGWFVGRVFRPNISIVRNYPEPKFSDSLKHLREVGVFLFNVGGYGPGSELNKSFGQIKVTDEQNKALADVMGDQWIGFDLGEQDARYHNSFQGLQLPSPRDRIGQHRIFSEWCDRVIDDQGGRLTLLVNLWGWHYPAQDGAMGMIGAQCHNKFGLTAPQVQYAFLRGAGKQYGLLWYGDVSIFSTFGVSSWKLDDAGNLQATGRGSSANLMRRTHLSQLLWNSAILGFEEGNTARNESKTIVRATPIGRVQFGTERLLQKGFRPGVMQTPVAILQDYFSGWMPARTNTTQFTAFNSMPYDAGNHLTDQLLSMVFPGYENCGWYMDERGAICPTPYGDIADCLLADAPAEILSRYNMVLVSGVENDLTGVRDRLDRFLSTGGVAMANGADAARLWPEYCKGSTTQLPAGTEVKWKDGATDQESDAFDVHDATAPAGAEVLATVGDRPAVVRIAHGGGTLVLALASTGMNRTALDAKPSQHPMWGGENTPLERPFRLLAHVRRAYDAALKSQSLFTAGDGLTVITCRRTDGAYVVGVSNPSVTSLPFAIRSNIGPIASVKEVDAGSDIHDLPGYWPMKYGPFETKPKEHRDQLGEITGQATPSDDRNIGGGDMRIFEVTLSQSTAKDRPDLKPPGVPTNRLLRVADLTGLRERLRAWPSFAYFFEGVAIDARALLDADADWLRENAEWFRRHGVRILVDGRGVATNALPALMKHLQLLGAGRELVVDSITDTVRESATQCGVTLRASGDVNVLAAGSVPARGTDGKIQVLEGDWRSWDGLYKDVRSVWIDPTPGRITGPKAPAEVAERKASLSRPNRYIALHEITDPASAVAERPGLLDHFDGLMLDATWLAGRSPDAIARDRAWLESRGLSVVIDFSRSINHFPDYTFVSIIPHRREASVQFFDATLTQMALLGAKQAVICTVGGSSDVKSEAWADQLKGMEAFLDKAASVGVTVHWRTAKSRPPSKLSEYAAQTLELRARHPNLRLAACTIDETDPAKLTSALAPAGEPELWLLAAPNLVVGRSGVRYLPLSTLPADTVGNILKASTDATVVFDADYLSWDEVLADVNR